MAGWHYSSSGTRFGPVPEESLKSLYTQGVLNDDTLVWNGDKSQHWLPYREVTELRSNTLPPPLPAYAISDFWIWLLAVVPIAGFFVENLVYENSAIVPDIRMVVLSYFFVNVVLAILDRRTIAKSGRVPPLSILVIITPLYLYVRSKRLAKSYAPLIAWVGSVVAAAYFATPN